MRDIIGTIAYAIIMMLVSFALPAHAELSKGQVKRIVNQTITDRKAELRGEMGRKV